MPVPSRSTLDVESSYRKSTQNPASSKSPVPVRSEATPTEGIRPRTSGTSFFGVRPSAKSAAANRRRSARDRCEPGDRGGSPTVHRVHIGIIDASWDGFEGRVPPPCAATRRTPRSVPRRRSSATPAPRPAPGTPPDAHAQLPESRTSEKPARLRSCSSFFREADGTIAEPSVDSGPFSGSFTDGRRQDVALGKIRTSSRGTRGTC
jgi:hypothetical protein